MEHATLSELSEQYKSISVLSERILKEPGACLIQSIFQENLEIVKKYGLTNTTAELLVKAGTVAMKIRGLDHAINELKEFQGVFLYRMENPPTEKSCPILDDPPY